MYTFSFYDLFTFPPCATTECTAEVGVLSSGVLYFTDDDAPLEGYTLYHGKVAGKGLDLHVCDLAKCAQKCTEDARCKGFTYGEIPRVFCLTKEDISQPPRLKPDVFGTRTYLKRF